MQAIGMITDSKPDFLDNLAKVITALHRSLGFLKRILMNRQNVLNFLAPRELCGIQFVLFVLWVR